MSKEHLATYLNDHLAGANLALETIDHLTKENPDLIPSLTALKTDIYEDRHQLTTLMERLNISESRIRKAGSWIAEGVAEVKLDVDDDAHGPLRRLERLEALAIGVDGKIALWRALEAAAGTIKTLSGMDYERLVLRGQDQRARIEALRLQAARASLAA
jgi:hypothetical protein